jgi:hypothetical protein
MFYGSLGAIENRTRTFVAYATSNRPNTVQFNEPMEARTWVAFPDSARLYLDTKRKDSSIYPTLQFPLNSRSLDYLKISFQLGNESGTVIPFCEDVVLTCAIRLRCSLPITILLSTYGAIYSYEEFFDFFFQHFDPNLEKLVFEVLNPILRT